MALVPVASFFLASPPYGRACDLLWEDELRAVVRGPGPHSVTQSSAPHIGEEDSHYYLLCVVGEIGEKKN